MLKSVFLVLKYEVERRGLKTHTHKCRNHNRFSVMSLQMRCSYWFFPQKRKHQWHAVLFRITTRGSNCKCIGSHHCRIWIGCLENLIQSDMATSWARLWRGSLPGKLKEKRQRISWCLCSLSLVWLILWQRNAKCKLHYFHKLVVRIVCKEWCFFLTGLVWCCCFALIFSHWGMMEADEPKLKCLKAKYYLYSDWSALFIGIKVPWSYNRSSSYPLLYKALPFTANLFIMFWCDSATVVVVKHKEIAAWLSVVSDYLLSEKNSITNY